MAIVTTAMDMPESPDEMPVNEGGMQLDFSERCHTGQCYIYLALNRSVSFFLVCSLISLSVCLYVCKFIRLSVY